MLQSKGLLPPAYMVPVRDGIATYSDGEQAESVPNPSRGEQHELEVGHYSTGTGNLEKNPPCNAEDNLRDGFRGY